MTAEHVRSQLGVPEDAFVSIEYGDPAYNDAYGCTLIWVGITGIDENGNETCYFAAGTFDIDTGQKEEDLFSPRIDISI